MTIWLISLSWVHAVAIEACLSEDVLKEQYSDGIKLWTVYNVHKNVHEERGKGE